MSSYLAPNHLLAAYASGIFPMADESGTIHWLAPDPRAIIELDDFKIGRSLRSVVRRGVFSMTIDHAFEDVMVACADRPEGTWISDRIKVAYCRLYEMGFGHSVEAWQGSDLAGGLYGVSIGGAFFGESMFHRVANASKAALVHLVAHMRERGMTLLDIQFITDHLRRFGAKEIPRDEYTRRLRAAVLTNGLFSDDAPRIVIDDTGEAE